jgi:hypothetical protein
LLKAKVLGAQEAACKADVEFGIQWPRAAEKAIADGTQWLYLSVASGMQEVGSGLGWLWLKGGVLVLGFMCLPTLKQRRQVGHLLGDKWGPQGEEMCSSTRLTGASTGRMGWLGGSQGGMVSAKDPYGWV